MKQFLHKRWHGIPVGIISAVMVVCLLAGGAVAAYNLNTSPVNVEVLEAINVQITGEDFTWTGDFPDTDELAITGLYPAGEKAGEMSIDNLSSGTITLTFTAPYVSSPDGQGGVSLQVADGEWKGLDGLTLSIPTGGDHVYLIRAIATQSAAPGTHTFTVGVSR